MAKKRIVVMYGGKADEHSISCISAASALRALDTDKFEAIPVGITKDGKVMVNEINTMPGFTSISMYPKAWEATGVRYTDLITMLIEGVLR